MKFNYKRIEYLKMIEGVIDRMSTKSGNVKGYCVAVVAGIVTLSFKNTYFVDLFLSVSTVLIFLYLDLYYLGMERKYRFLYEKVRNGGYVNFELKIDFKESEIKQSKSSIWDCLKSKTILRFYIPIFLILVCLLILRLKGVM